MEFTSYGSVDGFIPPGRRLGMPGPVIDAPSSPISNVLRELDETAIRNLLPHTGLAVVLDRVLIHEPTRATGYFLVLADDVRIKSHFGVMPGVLIAEFAHLTGAVLLMHATEEANIPVLNETRFSVTEVVLPGDGLECNVTLVSQSERAFSFSAAIYKIHTGKLVATVSFTGTRIPKRVFQRQLPRVEPCVNKVAPPGDPAHLVMGWN
ncbi:MAG: hypothetical protein Q8O53_02955 [Candidatus Moranbacteria bacterium]|nr:hypothetical protein [Candidatus Moranbacteria bacterium]